MTLPGGGDPVADCRCLMIAFPPGGGGRFGALVPVLRAPLGMGPVGEAASLAIAVYYRSPEEFRTGTCPDPPPPPGRLSQWVWETGRSPGPTEVFTQIPCQFLFEIF